jgi:carbonic anhydrase
MDFIKLCTIGLLSITLIQCSSARKKETSPAPTVAAPATPPTPPPAPAAVAETKPVKETEKVESAKELEDLKVSLKKAEAIVKKDAPHDAAHARKAGPVPADKALAWLKNGNTRYLKGFLRKDGASKKDIERLAAGQAPHTTILSCSDSRTPPEVVFDQKLGEIFVVRTAGQSLDNAVLASVEYAVEHLGTNLILVMGHTSCGAVKAALTTPVGGDTGSPYINALVAEIQPRISERMKGPASEGFVAEGWDNARGVSQKLLEKSKIIREAAKSGSLRVETALYHLKSGQVEWNH